MLIRKRIFRIGRYFVQRAWIDYRLPMHWREKLRIELSLLGFYKKGRVPLIRYSLYSLQRLHLLSEISLLYHPPLSREDLGDLFFDEALKKKALAALTYLAEVIVFVIDPTERCGYSLDKQLNLLAEVRKEFKAPLLVVVNKSDVASKAQLEAAEKAGPLIVEGEGVQSGLRDTLFKTIDWSKFNKKEAVFTPTGLEKQK